MAISDKTIEQLQEAVNTRILTAGEGKEFVTRPVFSLPCDEKPQPEALRVSTLTGFVHYIKSKDFCREYLSVLIQVVSHKEVRLVSSIYGECEQRDCYIVAAFEELIGKGFNFGTYYDHESFIVALQTLFLDTPARAEILKVVGTITDENISQFSDDGVTQTVKASAGLVMVKDVAVPNPVELNPFRTFRELPQPRSPFILRVRPSKGKPECALFEADGGKWKLDSIEDIREYLEDHDLSIPIIA